MLHSLSLILIAVQISRSNCRPLKDILDKPIKSSYDYIIGKFICSVNYH